MCGLRSSHFSRALHINASNNPDKKPESTTSWEKYEGPKTNQPTKVHIQTCLTREFSTLTGEICTGSSRLNPHETCTSRVTRSVSGLVGSGQEAFKSRWSDQVGSGQEVLKSHGSGRVGSTCFKISRVGSGRVRGFKISRIGSVQAKTSTKIRGSGPTRPYP